MSDPYDDFKAAFEQLLDAVGIAEAMVIATGMFVSLITAYIEDQGEDPNKEITVDGGQNRDITIHPPKKINGG